jgi:signal transduction histidine kinase
MEILHDCIEDIESIDKSIQFSSIKQLERICHFMNMTINRSIDFTKASSGIKLNPSIESINFSDSLMWAVDCMTKSSHTTVPVVISPIPASIYNQIFTDKHWLMENMLCLLSNAQKFTTEGEITIRCSLDEALTNTAGAVMQSTVQDFPSSSDIETGTSLSAPMNCGDVEEVEELPLMLLIEVEDSGIGITKENQERLFKPFAQVTYITTVA